MCAGTADADCIPVEVTGCVGGCIHYHCLILASSKMSLVFVSAIHNYNAVSQSALHSHKDILQLVGYSLNSLHVH